MTAKQRHSSATTCGALVMHIRAAAMRGVRRKGNVKSASQSDGTAETATFGKGVALLGPARHGQGIARREHARRRSLARQCGGDAWHGAAVATIGASPLWAWPGNAGALRGIAGAWLRNESKRMGEVLTCRAAAGQRRHRNGAWQRNGPRGGGIVRTGKATAVRSLAKAKRFAA